MESAEVYGKNRKFLTEISDAQPFTPTPEDGQDLYTADAKAYEKAIKKSGRAKFFEKTVRARHDDGVRGEDVRLRLLSVLRRERVHGDRVGAVADARVWG